MEYGLTMVEHQMERDTLQHKTRETVFRFESTNQAWDTGRRILENDPRYFAFDILTFPGRNEAHPVRSVRYR